MKKKILVFGTGKYYQVNKKYINEIFDVIALIDNDPKKAGIKIDGLEVISPLKIKEYNFEKIFIASMYADEIITQLINLGVPKFTIISKNNCNKFIEAITKSIINEEFISRLQNKFNKNLNVVKKQILFCISSLDGGGAEKVLVDLLNNIDYTKYNVDLVVIFNKGIYFNKINRNVNIITLFDTENEMINGFDIIKCNTAKQLHEKLIIGKYDVEISFLEGYPTKLISGADEHVKKITWIHINLNKFHWTKESYVSINEEKKCYESFNDIVFVSEEAKNDWKELFDIKNVKLNVIYNIFEVDRIMQLALEEKIIFDKFTFVTAGRLCKQKGYDRLIKAHSKLINEGLIHDIIILGIGEDEGELKKLCSGLGVDNSVKFLGFKNNPYKYIKNADVFISSSIVEGFPLVVGEALILGKAVIATKCTGNNEILRYGEFGMLVDNSEEEIFDGMKKILLNKDLVKKYEEKALLSKTQFNKEYILNKIYNIID